MISFTGLKTILCKPAAAQEAQKMVEERIKTDDVNGQNDLMLDKMISSMVNSFYLT